jgi:hypothetical protein
MNLRRLSSSLAAVALVAGLAAAAPAGSTSADGRMHRQDTGWGFAAGKTQPRWADIEPADTGWGSVTPLDTGWGIV